VIPSNGFDWSRQSRFGTVANGIVDYHWNEGAASYDPNYVNPAGFVVNLDGCRTSDDDIAGTSAMTYT